MNSLPCLILKIKRSGCCGPAALTDARLKFMLKKNSKGRKILSRPRSGGLIPDPFYVLRNFCIKDEECRSPPISIVVVSPYSI